MKLQISFDVVDLDKALAIARQVADYSHIIEIGTTLIYKHGAKAVEAFRQAFPSKMLLVDAKVSDRGADAVAIFAHAGADIITVMAGTSNAAIHATCTAAHKLNLKVMLDLLDASSLGQSAMEAKNLGANILLFHQPHDEPQTPVFLDRWEMVRGNTQLPIFISAKIKRTTINDALSIKPDGIIVGKGIVEADDPQAEAQFYYNIVSKQ